ncbi:MAG: MBOAT family O-acyltransferase [Jiangellaceae bacterium]
MLFPTIRFAIFFALVLPASWLLMPRPVRWRVFMIAASFAFYAAWDWGYTLLLAASIVVNQICSVVIDKAVDDKARNRRTAVAVALNLGGLGWYKYAEFLSDSGNSLLDTLGLDWNLPVPNILLPVGISFFTFQALSYVIDVRRRKVHPVRFLDFAVYLSFFPHLVAGPIVRAAEFLPQLRHRRDPRRVQAGLAFWLIGAGLFKKVVVASYLADRTVDPLFAFPQQHGGIEALFGVYAYAIQIYADFSGYTDMAIGLALLLGFRFPQNFDAPYTAASLQEFWRRWHMTLSRWLRDYLYVPLGGNRGGRLLTYRNLMLTMLLGGLWHGAAWTFVLWGCLHGAGLSAERWVDERRQRRRVPAHAAVDDAGAAGAAPIAVGGEPPVLAPPAPPAPRPDRPAGVVWIRRLMTFHLVCLAWIFFRSDTLGGAFDVIGRIAGGEASQPLNPVVVLVVVAMLASQFVPTGVVGRMRAVFSSWSLRAQVAAMAACLVAVDVLGPAGVDPFIYFQF